MAAVGLTAALTLALFFWFGGLLPLEHVVLADVSLVLLCLILLLGALARMVPRLRPLVPWGRELGIAMFVTAGLHTAMFIESDADLDVIGWFGDLFPGQLSSAAPLWVGSQWLGLGALAYAAVLAAISNDWSQRLLGRGWKFVQRQAYTLFVLAWLHTAAFLFFGAGHGVALPAWLFFVVTGGAVAAQFAGFGHTVLAQRQPSPHRVPPKATPEQRHTRMRYARWGAVVAVWAAFILVSWGLSVVQSAEEAEEARQVAELCDRYNELGRPFIAGDIRVELAQLLPPDWEPSDVTETAEACPTD